MAKSCKMIPSVRIVDEDGNEKIVPSVFWQTVKSGLKQLGISSPQLLHEVTKKIWKMSRKLQNDLGISGREITLQQASRAINILDYASYLRGISKDDLLSEISNTHLKKYLSNKTSLSFSDASKIVNDFNDENNGILPGVVAKINSEVRDGKTEYTVVLEDAYNQQNNLSYSEVEQVDNVAKEKAFSTACKKLIAKVKDACLAFGIDIEVVTDGQTSNWQLCKKRTGEVVSLIQIANDLSDEDMAKVLTEEFAHALLAGMSHTQTVSNVLETLKNKEGLVSLILSVDGDYKSYSDKYDGDKEQLAIEAAGKLLKWQLLQEYGLLKDIGMSQAMQSINDMILDKSGDKKEVLQLTQLYQTGLREATDEAASVLRNALPLSDDLTALRELSKKVLGLTNEELNELSETIDEGNKTFWQRFAELKNKDALQLYSLASERNKNEHIITQLNNIEYARAQNLRNAKHNDQLSIELGNKAIQRLDYQKAQTSAVGRYIDVGIHELLAMVQTLNQVFDAKSDYSSTEKAAFILRARVICNAYKSSLSIVKDQISNIASIDNEDTKALWEKNKDELSGQLKKLNQAVTDIEYMCKETSLDILAERIQPYLDKMGTNPFSLENKPLSAREILRQSEHDISFSERWLDSMQQTDDVLCRVIDEMAKEIYSEANQKTYQESVQIKNVATNLGIKQDTEWMYELDENGVPTGWMLAPYKYGAYNAELRKLKNELRKKGLHPGVQEWEKAVADWHVLNSVNDEEGHVLPAEKWKNPQFEVYMKDSTKKEFYEFFMSKKREIEERLPERSRSQYRAIQIRQNSLEVYNRTNKTSGFVKALYESAKNEISSSILTKVDDDEFGNVSDDDIQKLPIFFVDRIPYDSLRRLSMDPVSSLIAYASMANNYNAMNAHIDIFENMRAQAHDRNVNGNNNGGLTAERIDAFMKQVVYGQTVGKDKTITIGNNTISTQKAANALCRLTFVDKLAGNFIGGLSNYLVGNITEMIESIGARYYNHKDLSWAHKELWKNMDELLSDIGQNNQTSKINLLLQQFNLLQDSQYQYRNEGYHASRTQKIASAVPGGYFSAGEMMLAAQSALAVAHAIHVWDPQTESEMTLYDALTSIEVSSGERMSSILNVKEGVLIMEYDSISKTWKKTDKKVDDAYLNEYARKVTSINRKMHGIYNTEDQSALNQYALGRLALLFHRYIKSGINYRFGKAKYDFNEQEWTEGYHKTAGKFLLSCISDLRHGQVEIMTNWASMSDEQQSNCKKAIAEYATFAAFLGIGALLLGAGWGDDKSAYLKRIAAMLANRQAESMSVFVPSHKMPQAFSDAVFSFAPLSTIEDIVGLLGCFLPSSYSEYETSGKHRGHTKAYGYFMDSPIGQLFSMPDNILDPNTTIIRR